MHHNFLPLLQGSSNGRGGGGSGAKGRVAHLKNGGGGSAGGPRPLSAGEADSSLGSLNVESTAEHDGDIDEYTSDGLTTGNIAFEFLRAF